MTSGRRAGTPGTTRTPAVGGRGRAGTLTHRWAQGAGERGEHARPAGGLQAHGRGGRRRRARGRAAAVGGGGAADGRRARPMGAGGGAPRRCGRCQRPRPASRGPAVSCASRGAPPPRPRAWLPGPEPQRSREGSRVLRARAQPEPGPRPLPAARRPCPRGPRARPLVGGRRAARRGGARPGVLAPRGPRGGSRPGSGLAHLFSGLRCCLRTRGLTRGSHLCRPWMRGFCPLLSPLSAHPRPSTFALSEAKIWGPESALRARRLGTGGSQIPRCCGTLPGGRARPGSRRRRLEAVTRRVPWLRADGQAPGDRIPHPDWSYSQLGEGGSGSIVILQTLLSDSLFVLSKLSLRK